MITWTNSKNLVEASAAKPKPAAINGHSNTNAVLTAIIPKGSRKNNTANMVAINLQNNDKIQFECMNAIKIAHFLLYFDNAVIIFVFHHIHIN